MLLCSAEKACVSEEPWHWQNPAPWRKDCSLDDTSFLQEKIQA